MKITRSSIRACTAGLLVMAAAAAQAQLPAPNEAGVSTGHIHLTVPDPARHLAFWEALGGQARSSGEFAVLAFPGVYVLISEGRPAAPSSETVVNHVGFSVNDYAAYRETLDEIGAAIVFENAEDGQVIADLPDGVRLELLTDTTQDEPVAFHHVHLATAAGEAGLRDWYLDVFGADAGERRGLPSALVPGGRVDVMPARGQQPAGSQGAAIDHIGFEVADMEAFAAQARGLGIEFERPPMAVGDTGLTIAFMRDPAGTYIEITEGLESAAE